MNSQYLYLVRLDGLCHYRLYNILRLPPYLYPSDIVLGRDGVILFSGALLCQRLSVSTIMLSCQRMSTLIDFDPHRFVLADWNRCGRSVDVSDG
jgi:hypothetical protein